VLPGRADATAAGGGCAWSVVTEMHETAARNRKSLLRKLDIITSPLDGGIFLLSEREVNCECLSSAHNGPNSTDTQVSELVPISEVTAAHSPPRCDEYASVAHPLAPALLHGCDRVLPVIGHF